MKKMWGGRFSKSTDKLMEQFNASIEFDQVLAEVDVQGSLAHVAMLGKIGVLTDAEVQKIQQGLQRVLAKVQAGEVEFTLADEDIHMNIERLLKQEIGEVAGKLHTGRSRNDQVATDLHLYMREHVTALISKLKALQKALVQQAAQHIDTLLPGYTHLQRAQPIRLAHHLLAYVEMLARDVERLEDSQKRINTSPLGAGALAGAGFSVDREMTAELLGFERLYQNSLDAVSDRDYIIEFLAHAAIIMMHLSRLSEELILWMSKEFGFIQLDDAYCTGSSMMPQKKNPDIPELVRGKTGRVYGALVGLLTVMKSLPLAYNKDMQEDKEGVFDTLGTLHACLDLYVPLIETMQVNEAAMRQAVTQDFSNATEVADYLVKTGVPFREAHAIAGQLVMHCIQHQCLLLDLDLPTFQQFSSVIDDGIYTVLQPEHAVEARSVIGGTARRSVSDQLERWQ